MSKSLFFLTWKCNEGMSHGRGSAPYRHSDSTSRLWAVSKSHCLKQRASVRSRSLLVFLDSLASHSNACKVDLEAGPLDSRHENQPSEEVQDCAKAVTSRNQQRNDAFISTQTQHQPRDSNTAPRWRHATATRGSRVFPGQRVETHMRSEPAEFPRATRGNPRAKRDKGPACLNQQKQVTN